MTTQATSSIFPRCISFAHSLPRQPSKLDVVVVRKQQDQYYRDVLLYKTLSSGCWKTSTIEQTPCQRCASAVTREWSENGEMNELTSLQLKNCHQRTSHSHPRKIYIAPTFQARLCLILRCSKQSKRQFISAFKRARVHQLALSCGPPLVEFLSMSSPLRDILAWHFPPCFSRGLLFSCSTLQ